MTMLTFPQYAKHRKANRLPGATRQAVHAAVATGRIHAVNDRIDPVSADLEWERNTNPNQQRAAMSKTAEQAQACAAADVPPADDEMPDAAECVRRRTWWQSEAERLKVEVAKGDLVPAAEASRIVESGARLVAATFDAAVETGAVELNAAHAVPLAAARAWLRDWTRAVLTRCAGQARSGALE